MSESVHIVDTGVLMYFLLVGREHLLVDLLGWPLEVPVSVYDPEDRTPRRGTAMRTDLVSEMRQAVMYHQAAVNSARGPDAEGRAHQKLQRIARVDSLFDEGKLVPVAMTNSERFVAARLQEGTSAEYGLRAPLGAGEAACVAIAYERGWTIATDDDAALRVLGRLHDGQSYPYERIRKLLIRAADEGRITREEANRLHGAMLSLGFWDSGQPFP